MDQKKIVKLIRDICIRIFIYFGASISILMAQKEYFQQHVSYEIDVKLDDQNHTLSAFEKIEYTNNSPDTLEYIWFHIWPNAYKNDSTALAKQLLRLGSTRFHYSRDKDRGFIDSLDFSVNGIAASWEYHTDWIDVIKVLLPSPLYPGRSSTIETPFYVKLPKIFSRLGHTGKHYEITQWYPKPAVYDKDGWHPMPYLNMGEFYSEFGSFDVTISLPKEYRVMATGDLFNSGKELQWLDSLALLGESLLSLDNKQFDKKIKALKKNKKTKLVKDGEKNKLGNLLEYKTLRFKQNNVHDFAWFADPNWIVNKGELWLEKSQRKVTLWSMYLPKNAKLWKRSIEYLHDSGYWYSKFYGDYPYNHLTAVDGDMSAGGGMEYPNITVISTSFSEDLLEFVIMHEVGHNWFYGILGNNEREFTWMDEGLNEYSNIRYWEKKYRGKESQIIFQDFLQNKLGIGKDIDIHSFHYLGFAGSGKNKDAQPLNISANENFNMNNYSQNYNRPAVMLRFLQHYIGEEKMDTIMQKFYKEWQFRHPSPDDFRYYFDFYLDEDLDWFFDNVFSSTASIDFGIKKIKNRFLVQNLGGFNAPYEIAYYNKDGDQIERNWYRQDQEYEYYQIPDNCFYAVIDPDQMMPDIVRTNNSTKRKFKMNFIFDKPSYYHTDVNIIPWLFSYNTYNGFTPGISAWYGFLPGYGSNSAAGYIAYDRNNNEPVGSIRYINQNDYFDLFHQQRLTLNLSKIEGHKGASIGFNGVIKKPITKSPRSTIRTNIFYHDLLEGAFDQRFYDEGKYSVGEFSYTKRWIKNLFHEHSLGMVGGIGRGFLKSRVFGEYKLQMTKKIRTTGFISIDAFIIDKIVPKQYRNFIFGSTDPNFTKLVLNRTPQNNDLKVLENTFHGIGIRGIDPRCPELSTVKPFFQFKIDQSVPFVPGEIFLDVAKSFDKNISDPNFLSAGFVFGPIIIPVYQSWGNDNYPKNLNWLGERIRVRLPTINF